MMADYRDDRTATSPPRNRAGLTVAVILFALVAIVVALFATGFWQADVKEGALPDVKVTAKGGEMPDVDLKSKELVVGTKSTTVEVPKIETEKTAIDVPVVAVRDGDTKK